MSDSKEVPNDVDGAAAHRVVVRLPERETYVANAILSCLRGWKRHHDSRYEGKSHTPPWHVEDCDLQQLEEWAAKLWETWQATHDRALKDGDVIQQPSRVGSKYV